MTKIASSKQKRQRPVEDEAEMLNPLHYENDVLHVYGTPLKPHADFPWLWNSSSLLNAVISFQRGNGVSEAALAKFKRAKSPRKWVAEKEQYTSKWKATIRTAGRLQKQELAVSGCMICHTPKPLDGYAVQKINGGRHQGTYLCASLIVAYCRYLHPEFGALVDDFFARGLQGSNSVIAEVQVNAERNVGRSAERIKQLKTYPSWDTNNRAHGASTIRSNGEVFYHVTDGEYGTQEAYCSEHGIDKPYSDNLPDAVVQRTNLVREVAMTLADKKNIQGQNRYDETIACAANIADLVREDSEAVLALAAASGFNRKQRRQSQS